MSTGSQIQVTPPNLSVSIGVSGERLQVEIDLNRPAPTLLVGVTQSYLQVGVALNQGLRGPRGTWGVDRALLLRQLSLPVVDGRVEIDFGEANTFYLLLTEDVVQIDLVGLPAPGNSSRVQVYVQQDEIGGRLLTGWPSGTRTPSGLPPILTTEPRSMDSIVLDTFDGGASIQLNLVGQDYAELFQ